MPTSLTPPLVTASSIKIIGIAVRTTNADESNPTTAKIPALYERFFTENIEAQIPNRINPERRISVLCDYESDDRGAYTQIVGVEVSTHKKVPQGMVAMTVPGGEYQVFSGHGAMPDVVIDEWRTIWEQYPSDAPEDAAYRRAYRVDYEIYYTEDPTRVDVYLSLRARHLQQVTAALCEFALGFPEAYEDFAWGERVLKVNKKVFVFMHIMVEEGSRLAVTVKLPHSNEEALLMSFAEPTGYKLGRFGWVSAHFGLESNPPLELLMDWIEESYRTVAPKKLVAELDATLHQKDS